jgi:hypothetical protein
VRLTFVTHPYASIEHQEASVPELTERGGLRSGSGPTTTRSAVASREANSREHVLVTHESQRELNVLPVRIRCRQANEQNQSSPADSREELTICVHFSKPQLNSWRHAFFCATQNHKGSSGIRPHGVFVPRTARLSSEKQSWDPTVSAGIERTRFARFCCQ